MSLKFCSHCLSLYQGDLRFCVTDGYPLSSVPTDPLIGRHIEGYRIEAVIGVGSTGRVYKTWNSQLEQPFALKLIWGDVSSDLQIFRRIQRAASAAHRIHHPNVVRVLEHGTTPRGLTYLVMELIQGTSLREHLSRRGPLSPLFACQIASKVAEGLFATHTAGFVHRDIKPANIIQVSPHTIPQAPANMTATHGVPTGSLATDVQVKILDFGLVGIACTNADARITASGSYIGTPLYMAPEQAKSASDVGPQADIYSLGIMLFEMLTGAPPFEGHNPLEVMIAHSTHPTPYLRHLGELGDLVAWALEKTPQHRPPSAQVFGEHLRSIVRQLAVHPVNMPSPCTPLHQQQETDDIDFIDGIDHF